jgi:hypothetical protein
MSWIRRVLLGRGFVGTRGHFGTEGFTRSRKSTALVPESPESAIAADAERKHDDAAEERRPLDASGSRGRDDDSGEAQGGDEEGEPNGNGLGRSWRSAYAAQRSVRPCAGDYRRSLTDASRALAARSSSRSRSRVFRVSDAARSHSSRDR